MTELSYRRHIDGLRAVAVLAVVAFHAGVPWLPGGYVGVDVFFVVSGFLITGLLLREFERRGDISLVGFYERRVRRLAPALLLVLAVTLALGAVYLVPIGGEQQGLAKSAIATVLLGSNVWFAHATGGYFDAPAAAQPLLHTWSLSVEEQFYLVWPALLLLAGRWSLQRKREPAKAIALVLALVGVASLVLSVITTQTHPELAFFGSPTRAWEFAIGGLAFFLVRKRSTPLPLAQPLAWLGLAAILWACVRFTEGATPFPGWRAGIPALAAALVILGGEHAEKGLCTRLLALQPIVLVGLLSYSLYLWHWPLLVVARLDTLGEIGPWGIAGICALSFVLAWLTYAYVENPLRRKHYPLMATRQRAFSVGAVGCLGVMVLAGGLGVWAREQMHKEDNRVLVQAAQFDNNDAWKGLFNCLQDIPYSGRIKVHGACNSLSVGKATKVLLWGDSHAAAILPAVNHAAHHYGSAVAVRAMPGCPPLPGYVPRLDGLIALRKSALGGCRKFNNDVLNEALKAAQNGLKIVVLDARWPIYTDDPRYMRDAASSLNSTINILSRHGLRVMLLAPSVTLPHSAPKCLSRRSARDCGILREKVRSDNDRVFSMLSGVAGSNGLRLQDPVPYLCADAICPAIENGRLFYIDDDHLSESGSMMLSPLFLNFFGKYLNGQGGAE